MLIAQFCVGQCPSWFEFMNSNQEIEVVDAAESGKVLWIDDRLAPDERLRRAWFEPYLFSKLSLECAAWGLTFLTTATGRDPIGFIGSRSKLAQQYSIRMIHDQRSRRTSDRLRRSAGAHVSSSNPEQNFLPFGDTSASTPDFDVLARGPLLVRPQRETV
ncbi:hypothetical protein EN35_15355 [Rhodococcus qingshengii]|nr:hypothetical protein EN35_15355 [Rhodococcus qingshengii]